MTAGFFAAAAALLLLTLVLLLRPYWWRQQAAAGMTQRRINIAIHRDQLDELERDRASGTLAEADYATAKQEIQRRLLEDSSEEDAAPITPQPAAKMRATPLAIMLAVPLIAGGLYAWLGSPGAINAPTRGTPASESGHNITAGEFEGMVKNLAAKLESQPDNFQGWAMLARSYKALNRYAEAAQAYSHAGSFIDNDPALLADYADVLVASSNSFAGKPMQLLDKALKLEPDNGHALWLRGTALFEAGKYDQAIGDWARVLEQMPPDSEDAGAIRASIAEARARGGSAPSAGKAADKTTGKTTGKPESKPESAPTQKVGASGTVGGRVEVAAALKNRVAADDVVMVIARPADGSRMPAAVLRVRATELPLSFTLDDTLAVSPDKALSKLKEVSVEVRISKTGMATPQAGDLISAAQVVAVGKHDLRLQVDQVRK